MPPMPLMPPRQNPLKLNKLQLRTLALAQLLAATSDDGARDAATGAVTLTNVPRPHADHVHIADIVVSRREASGLSNPAVWTALQRKGLARADDPFALVLTKEGIDYDTGLADRLRPT